MARSLCAMCDGWYDDSNEEEVRVHAHPEPQSGPPRDAWVKSRLPYEEWIWQTKEGRNWFRLKVELFCGLRLQSKKIRLFELSPELTDGQHKCYVRTGEEVLKMVKEWCDPANGKVPGESFTVTTVEKTEEEFNALPEI